MNCSNGGCDGNQSLTYPTFGYRPFYLGWRDGHSTPFGLGTVKAGDRIIKYCAANDAAGSVISIYYGGAPVTVLRDTSSPYDTYSNWDGTFTATRGSNILVVTAYGVEYEYDDPVVSANYYGRLLSYDNSETGETATYAYAGGAHSDKLITITLSSGDIDLIWAGGGAYTHIERIEFPNGTVEEFLYNGDTPKKLIGWKETFDSQLIQYASWTQAGNGLIATVDEYDPTDGTTVLRTSEYTWGSNYVLDTYTFYGEEYSISRAGSVKTITDPEGGKSVSTVTPIDADNDETLYQIKTSGNSVVSSRETVKNLPYRVITSEIIGTRDPIEYTYGFDIDSGTDITHARLTHRVTAPLDNYIKLRYDSTNMFRVGLHNSSNAERAHIRIDYDGSDRVEKIHTGTLWDMEINYDGSDRIGSIEDGENRTTTFGYDADDRIETITIGSAVTEVEYTEEGKLERYEVPSGIATRYLYDDTMRNLVEVYQDDDGPTDYVTTYEYDLDGLSNRLTAVIDAENRKTGYEYDEWGRLEYERAYTGTGSYSIDDTITYAYDPDIGNRLASKIDMNGHTTEWAYNEAGWVTGTEWTASGGGSAWGTLTFSYNQMGQINGVTPTGGDCGCSPSLTLAYDGNGQLTSRTAMHNGSIVYEYDDVSRLDKVKIPDNTGGSVLNTVDFGYDAASRVSTIDPTLLTDHTYTYNKANQVTRVEYADLDSTDTEYTYDATTGRVTKIKYDPVGNSNDRQVEYAYNADGLRTKATYESTRQVTYMYDNLNRLTFEAGHASWGSESCISLNGSQSISIASGAPLGNDHRAFSVEARILLDTYPAGANLAKIFERGSLGSENWFRFYIDSSGILRANIETEDTDESVAWILNPLPLGEWIHLAATWYEDEKIKLYVNGVRVAQSGVAPGADLDTFAGSPTIGSGLDGKIDEVVVYGDSEPAPTDFSEDSNYGGAPLGSIDGWHFQTGTGTTQTSFMGGKTATVPSGSWSNANLEPKPAVYEYRYKYDKVGNRTEQLLFKRSGAPTVDRWVFTYNDLNQFTQRNHYTDILSSSYDEKWLYTYDDNGNLTIAEKQNGSNVKQEKWVYSWNPRDQMTKAEKFTGTGDTYAGKVEYEYCLSCDGALSRRKEYDTTLSSKLESDRRYEYDGLNLLRIDERRDTDNDGEIESGETDWRIVEVATHAPGIVSNLLGKRVYNYANGSSSSPSSTTDYGYVHDAVGNVLTVFTDDDDEGDPTYFFHQDAFGNEVSVPPFSGSSWATARAAGVTEHQTGKWIDSFTGLYFFHARWNQSGNGRFVTREPLKSSSRFVSIALNEPVRFNPYTFAHNCPITLFDTDGRFVATIPILIGAGLGCLGGLIYHGVISGGQVVVDPVLDPDAERDHTSNIFCGSLATCVFGGVTVGYGGGIWGAVFGGGWGGLTYLLCDYCEEIDEVLGTPPTNVCAGSSFPGRCMP